MTERLLTAREVGEMLDVSAETVLRWTRAGELRGYRLPGSVRGRLRYRLSEVEAWLERRATAGAANREAPTTRRRARRAGAYGTLDSFSPTTPPPSAATTEEDS
jgi:excisionase family DNA binding protein